MRWKLKENHGMSKSFRANCSLAQTKSVFPFGAKQNSYLPQINFLSIVAKVWMALCCCVARMIELIGRVDGQNAMLDKHGSSRQA